MKIYVARFEGIWYAWSMEEGTMVEKGFGSDLEGLKSHINEVFPGAEIVDADKVEDKPADEGCEGCDHCTCDHDDIPEGSFDPYVYKPSRFQWLRNRLWLIRAHLTSLRFLTGIMVGMYIMCKIFIPGWPWWL